MRQEGPIADIQRRRHPDLFDRCPAGYCGAISREGMKVLFGMALRQTTGFVESLWLLTGLDWVVPDFSTLSRRRKTLAVNIRYCGSKGPLHLLIPSRDIALRCPAGQWTVRASRSRVKASGMHASPSHACRHVLPGSAWPQTARLAHTTRADVTTPLLTAVRPQSFRHARLPSRGSHAPLAPSPGTTRSAHRSIWAGRSGGTAAAIIAGAASRQALSGSCCA